MSTHKQPPHSTDEVSKHEVARLIGGRAAELQRRYLDEHAKGHSGAQATLAQLRHGAGKPIGAIPEIVDITIGGLTLPGHGDRDEPYAVESASYAALTLFACHQQSQKQPMHVQYRSLGAAMGELKRDAGDHADGIIRAFNAVVSATSFSAIVYYTRRAIQLLRQKGIPLDYGRLAEDFRDLQHPARSKSVLLRWGRDFYRQAPKSPETKASDTLA